MADEKIEAPPADVTPPTLSIQEEWAAGPNWYAGPDIHIQAPKTDDKQDLPKNVPQVQAYTVSTGDVVDQVHTMLYYAKDQVEHYNTFKDYVNARKDWIFCVTDESQIGADGDPYSGATVLQSNNVPGSNWGNTDHHPTEGHEYYGATREQVTQINTYMDNLLMACADVIHLVGQYALAVDGAAQAYANTDFAAKFPDPPPLVPII